MPDGGTLDIRTLRGSPRAAAGGESWVGLEVGDSGTGMDAATQARLFEPFFSTKGARGTGLGLASVRAITTEFGGTVEVDSALGRGTRFTLWFPARPDAATADTSTVPPPRVRRVTILLAEDDPAVRRVMASTLRGAGHEVLDAGSVDAAIDIARRARGTIALLCTDAVMPGGGLRPLVDAFRELFPGAPVLVCSGYLSPDLPTPGELDAAFLAKPFAPDALIAKVHELLALGHAPPRTPIAGTPTLPAPAQRS
jgi:CheY-like chemotaxis protein